MSINGGSPNSEDNLDNVCNKPQSYFDALGVDKERFREILKDIGKNWKPLKELIEGTKGLASTSIHTMSEQHLYKTDSPHKSLSIIWAGMEKVLLCLLFEVCIESTETKILPVVLEHDGLLVVSNGPPPDGFELLAQKRLDKFAQRMRWNLHFPVAIKNLTVPNSQSEVVLADPVEVKYQEGEPIPVDNKLVEDHNKEEEYSGR